MAADRERPTRHIKQIMNTNRMFTTAFVSTVTLAFAMIADGSESNALSDFERANQDYAAGKYSEAAHGFEKVIAQQGFSAPVLLNLGNAWLEAGEPGRAILNYERALVLAPGDDALVKNLQIAREKANVTNPKPGILYNAVHVLSWNALSWLCALSIVGIAVLVLTGRLKPLWAPLGRGLAVGVCAIVFCITATSLAVRWPDLNLAVILNKDTPVRIAPADSAGVSFKLPAGELVQARKNHGNFVLIRTNDGKSGWASRDEVARIMAAKPDQGATQSVAASGGHNS